MKKLLLTLICAFALAAASFAKDSTKVAYLPSRFPDNWFLQLGGGVNTVFNSGFGPVSPAAEFFIGKWFTPAVGARLGVLGGANRPNGTETGWFSGRDGFHYGHADLDFLWNMFNSFKYNEHRFWDIVPYVRASAIYTKQQDARPHIEPGFGVGIHNGLRLGKRVDLYIEATVVGAREKAYRERGNVAFFPTATAGFIVRVGTTGYRKPAREKVTQFVEVERVVEKKDTVTIEKTVVDSVLIKEMREHPLTLYFEIDVTILTQRELDHLERYALYVLNPNSKVLLTGSADKETGNPSHNQWLSEQRNAYVKDILVRVYGLKPENIQEIANGDRKNEFRTPEQNRCVTISFIE